MGNIILTVVYYETDFILWVGGLYIVVDDFFENSLIGFIAGGKLVAIVYRYDFRFNCVGIRCIRDIVRGSAIG